MYRAHVTVQGREMTFDFPQTVARDEITQKVFSVNRSWKNTLSPGEGDNYPDIYITWENLDAPEQPKVAQRAPDMGQDGVKTPTDASPDSAPADSNDLPENRSQVVETPAG